MEGTPKPKKKTKKKDKPRGVCLSLIVKRTTFPPGAKGEKAEHPGYSIKHLIKCFLTKRATAIPGLSKFKR